MATTNTLIALGMPPELAKRVGYQLLSVTLTANTQGSAGGLLRGPGNKIVQVTPGTNGFGLTLPADAEIGDEIIAVNGTANTAVIFPEVGGAINGNATNATVAMAASGTATSRWRFVKTAALTWAGWEDGDV